MHGSCTVKSKKGPKAIFAKNLDAGIKALGLTRAEFARATKVDYDWLRRACTQGVAWTTEANRKYVDRIAEYLGVSGPSLWHEQVELLRPKKGERIEDHCDNLKFCVNRLIPSGHWSQLPEGFRNILTGITRWTWYLEDLQPGGDPPPPPYVEIAGEEKRWDIHGLGEWLQEALARYVKETEGRVTDEEFERIEKLAKVFVAKVPPERRQKEPVKWGTLFEGDELVRALYSHLASLSLDLFEHQHLSGLRRQFQADRYAVSIVEMMEAIERGDITNPDEIADYPGRMWVSRFAAETGEEESVVLAIVANAKKRDERQIEEMYTTTATFAVHIFESEYQEGWRQIGVPSLDEAHISVAELAIEARKRRFTRAEEIWSLHNKMWTARYARATGLKEEDVTPFLEEFVDKVQNSDFRPESPPPLHPTSDS